MKALLVTSVFPPITGGSGRWFWEIYRRLPREQVIILAGDHPKAAEFDSEHNLRIRRQSFSMTDWGLRSLQALRVYWQILNTTRRIIKQERVSQLHCGACLPDGWVAYLCHRLFGIPYITYMHGEELCYAGSSRELNWMCRKVLSSSEFVVANSENTRGILLEKWRIPEDKIEVLTPGVDCDRFIPQENSSQIRQQLGWDNRKVVLTVGRLQKRKGHDSLIRAIPFIRKRVPQFLYSIAGDGDERANLEDLAKKLNVENSVQFRGETTDDELIACYQQCDVFSLPNRQIGDDLEGFGMVLVEAQACGKPVIAGNTGGTAETMRIPETGITLDCDDTLTLSQTLIELLTKTETRTQMGLRGREWVKEQFDWPVLTKRANNLLLGQRQIVHGQSNQAVAGLS